MADDIFEISLKNCSFYGFHGVLEDEKRLGQRFFIDVTMKVIKPDNFASDQLENTVHYGEVFEEVETVTCKERYDLIETLAHYIGVRICDRFPKVLSVIVTVRKPSAPIDGVFDCAEVRVETKRQN